MRTIALTALALLALAASALADGPKVPAQPVAAVQAEKLPPPDSLVVVELFSSQACVFCPAADKLFAEMIKQPHVIGVACHIDYFDVRRGALSHPFCTERQSRYEALLHAGANYTPQMVMQGQIDVVGHKSEAVAAGIKKAQAMDIVPLSIAPSQAGAYTMTLPEGWKAPAGTEPSLWLMLYDKPHDVTVAGGRNRGQKMTYLNIVSSMKELGAWPADQSAMSMTPPLVAEQQGFAVLLQDKISGKILAAGKYEISG